MQYKTLISRFAETDIIEIVEGGYPLGSGGTIGCGCVRFSAN
jgi:hypothetical protein